MCFWDHFYVCTAVYQKHKGFKNTHTQTNNAPQPEELCLQTTGFQMCCKYVWQTFWTLTLLKILLVIIITIIIIILPYNLFEC